ncbi:efflux RND transporter periplasmic adaptor subunit [Polaribacter glomeratus]|uniref:Efflux transporter periplasmic adaptor subunit n=1 Tax=Polaribacter glomeratus TaxID=102 RepID=A0A2S7WGT1_9FLAO|nr:efflux RND transporter periplasmic adaptor subunit [Polaribacter glomeratus]PQJ76823.1 efflux transporter periplasmic adaptor subunit [Polaribacter glomeratus]TXD67332.1 efflux RND transporter periplasmic adaptor subunit [Polaribacter glomeratus]
MNHTKLITLLALCSFLVILSCANKQENNAGAKETPPATFPVTQLQAKTITGYQEYPTNLEGIINSEVRAKTSGYIQKVFVDEGQKVKKGQVLFQLETQSLSQDAGAAKARVNVAQVEVNKLIPLVEKNIISAVQLETAKANLAQAKANYSSVSASIGYATIKSPIDGNIGAINFREGALVSTNDAISLTSVSNITQVYAFFSLTETQYLDFLQNSEGTNVSEKLANFPAVNLILANGTMFTEKGKIQTSTGQINKNTGTVSLRAVFNNPTQLLTNGNSGTIQIPIIYKDAIVIPQAATYEQQGNIMLYKLGKNNTVLNTIVKVKTAINHLYVITSGLDLNDKIIVSGVGKLKDGMTISPQETSFEEAMKPITTLFKN